MGTPKAKKNSVKASRSPGKADSPQFIVGIGSSAGGLEALRSLFGSFREVPAMSFVVVQHLAPMHRSRLVEIISHSTKLKVKEVEDGEAPRSRVVYITPPNRDVFLEQGRLRLKVPQLTLGPKPSVDLFFRSLADSVGGSAIGVVLSGTGTDGAHGVRAIKAAGGLTISQKVESAKYDGMPKAASLTGSVDLELTPEEIARELTRFHGLKRSKKPKVAKNDPYDDILSMVERRVGASFSHYKQSTVRRRIHRRMMATRCDTVAAYWGYLERVPEEAKNLFQDILISVTSFFRDAQAFRALGAYMENIVHRKAPGSMVRIWVIGCATGEEVYSLAILLAEAMEKEKKNLSVQIFATDLDEPALAIARKGIYSRASFDDFPSDWRKKYFNSLDDSFQVKPFLRDWVVFSRHNVAEDPPFLNMDLVSCRNVLIYFGSSLQEKVFRTIHYSLVSEGILFLGRSEAASNNASGLFEVKDKNSKIYRRGQARAELPKSVVRAGNMVEVAKQASAAPENSGDELFLALVEGLAPNSVLVDEDGRLKHVFGHANRFLKLPKGEASNLVTKLLPNEIGSELTLLLHRAGRRSQAARGRRHELGRGAAIRLAVVPLRSRDQRSFLVAFHAMAANPAVATRSKSPASESSKIKALQKELAIAREHLQSVVEEQETTNEELQSLNEELQSANEELQSSNEELETTNEEMQSSNEELTTLNQELNVKSTELSVLNTRLQAIQNAIVYPLLIVDRNMQIANFNPSARHLLKLGEGDVGSHLRAVPTGIDIHQITASVEQALKARADQLLQFKAKERTFEVRIQIYHADGNEVDGAVISFVENTEIATALEESRMIKGRLSAILDHTPAMVTMKDMSGVYMYANRQFCDLAGIDHHDLLGETDEDIFGAGIAREIRARDYEVLKQERPIQFEESMEIKGRTRHWTSAKFPLFDAKRRPYSLCTVSLEITDRVSRERQLELFRRAIASATNGTVLLENQGKGFRVTFCSAPFAAQIGQSADLLLGLTLEELLRKIKSPGSAEWIAKAVKKIESQASASVAFTLPLDGGQEASLEMRTSQMSHAKDGSKHLILSIFDITQHALDQRTIAAQAEELTRFGRFSSLGEIAAGIAHEINTPLNVITTKTDILRKSAQLKRLKEESVIKTSEDIDRMAQSISSIVLGLKSVVGMEPEKFETAIVQNLIRDALKICEYRLQRFGIVIRIHLPEKPLTIECYPVQVIQILINLINNSVDAVSDLSERWLDFSLAEGRESVVITIVDSGRGIDPSLAEKIMTPFFTTKKDQKGTGIGLSLSRTIARRHNGDLTLDLTRPNTTFRLELAKHHR